MKTSLFHLLLLLLGACANGNQLHEPFDTAAIRHSIKPLSFSNTENYSKEILDYFDYYGLNHASVPHFFGTFISGSYTCAAHIYKPEKTFGTVFLVHGYYDHTGIVSSLISLFLKEHYSVAVFDLPGHGFSSGPRVSIDSFPQYTKALRDFFAQTKRYLPKPYIACGHSTGCSVILDYCFRERAAEFRDIILIAPLIRSEYWHMSKLSYFFASPFTSTIHRWLRNATSDTAYLAWFARDPLQVHTFPLEWGKALFSWEKWMRKAKPRPLPVTIIQGIEDHTVDWRYNIPFLEKKIPGCSVVFINHGEHQLMNEAEPMKSQTLESIGKVLRKNNNAF